MANNKCCICGRSEKQVSSLLKSETGAICNDCAIQAYRIVLEQAKHDGTVSLLKKEVGEETEDKQSFNLDTLPTIMMLLFSISTSSSSFNCFNLL